MTALWQLDDEQLLRVAEKAWTAGEDIEALLIGSTITGTPLPERGRLRARLEGVNALIGELGEVISARAEEATQNRWEMIYYPDDVIDIDAQLLAIVNGEPGASLVGGDCVYVEVA
jgi:hypothetical protein